MIDFLTFTKRENTMKGDTKVIEYLNSNYSDPHLKIPSPLG
ncbi:hypothetical protein CRENPOLYSF2_2210002 [Crenothrix polyspora]|uniref:Uncharacterized protein n=1 Tax=Crenothrix polyspora TaxID=360316 RepID=A0A1R4H575_9GAMM|nr:hypothetical protein CRENPOLYSF2_2210002 [Crenothrix polyspora]